MMKGRYRRQCLYYTPFLEFLEECSFRKKPSQSDCSRIKKSSLLPFFYLCFVWMRDRYFAMNVQQPFQSFLTVIVKILIAY